MKNKLYVYEKKIQVNILIIMRETLRNAKYKRHKRISNKFENKNF